MTGFGSSSSSTSLAASSPSSCCFLKPSVTVSTMKGLRMALKISLFPSMATKWRLALWQAWTDALSQNQGRCKQKHHNKKWQSHEREVNKKLCTSGCSAIKNYVANLRGGLNDFSLPLFQGMLLFISWVSFIIKLKRTSSKRMLIPIESSLAIGLVENVEEGSPR